MIFVIGNSHTEMLMVALAKTVGDEPVHHLRFGPTGLSRSDAVEQLIELLDIKGELNSVSLHVAAERKNARFLISIGGNAHFLFAHREMDPRIIFFHPEVPVTEALAEERTVIPLAIVESLVEDRILEQFAVLPDVQFPAGRTVHYSSPPPVYSSEFILNDLADRVAAGLAVSPGVEGSVAPPDLRLAAWKINTAATKKQCELRNLPFMYPPESTLDRNGFLAESALSTSGNSTHANHWYAAEILRSVRFLDGSSFDYMFTGESQ